MKILLVDNYDSFTYNLLHYLEGESNTKVDVIRNDQLDSFDTMPYTHIVISPGPGLPRESGGLLSFIQKNKEKKILGVCLGQQAIAEAFSLPLKQLEKVVHGQASQLNILQEGVIFLGLPKSFKVGRYHSWVVDFHADSNEFKVLAIDEKGHCMALQHNALDLTAVQFHPESILTEYGRKMIGNWIGRKELE